MLNVKIIALCVFILSRSNQHTSFVAQKPSWAQASSNWAFLNNIQLYTQESVELLWTRDRPLAKTSTWQYKTITKNIRVPGWIRSSNPSNRWAASSRLKRFLTLLLSLCIYPYLLLCLDCPGFYLLLFTVQHTTRISMKRRDFFRYPFFLCFYFIRTSFFFLIILNLPFDFTYNT